MTPEEVLDEVLEALEHNEIPYMVTGSYASNLHGTPRATIDGDVVIDPAEANLRAFVRSLQQTYYADEAMAVEALRRRFMFNVIHLSSTYKIDLIIKKSSAYEDTAFARKVKGTIIKKDRWFISAEDIILAKLQWHSMGGSERQLDDVIAVIKLNRGMLDMPYVRTWATTLRVDHILDKILRAFEQDS